MRCPVSAHHHRVCRHHRRMTTTIAVCQSSVVQRDTVVVCAALLGALARRQHGARSVLVTFPTFHCRRLELHSESSIARRSPLLRSGHFGAESGGTGLLPLMVALHRRCFAWSSLHLRRALAALAACLELDHALASVASPWPASMAPPPIALEGRRSWARAPCLQIRPLGHRIGRGQGPTSRCATAATRRPPLPGSGSLPIDLAT